jgi:predicted aconitase with swiveling domain
MAAGPIVVLDEPLSMWGGFDSETGVVIDEHHPQVGTLLTGAVVVMATGRGSSSASSVLAEAARLGTAPAGFVMQVADEILTTGAIVADELYGTPLPIVIVDQATFARVSACERVSIRPDGTIVEQ